MNGTTGINRKGISKHVEIYRNESRKEREGGGGQDEGREGDREAATLR